MENGDRTDGRHRQDGDNSGRYNTEENQVVRIERDAKDDGESLVIYTGEELCYIVGQKDPFVR